MVQLKNISLRRVFARAWRTLWPHAYAALIAYGVAGSAVALIGLQPRAEPGYFSRFLLGPLAIAGVFGSGPAALIVFVAARRFRKTRWPEGLDAICPKPRRIRIAAAPNDGSTAVVLEGRVTSAGDEPPLRAPLCGLACTYYRVRIETWDGTRLPGSPMPAWSRVDDRALLRRFVVTDDSAFVRIEPLVPEREARSPSIDPVDIELDEARSVTVHESITGIVGLPAETRAYVESIPAHSTWHLSDRRVRVVEARIQEGHIVSVFGTINDRFALSAPEPTQGAEFRGTMSGFPKTLRVVLATLEEIRWLESVNQYIVLGLIGTGIALLALHGAGLAILLGR